MIYKSYLLEHNINSIKENLCLFYGENLGLKNDFKEKIKLNYKNKEIINFVQDSILKSEENFFSEVLNVSLFGTKKIFFIEQSNDKIFDIVKAIEPNIDDQKIFIFADTLEKKSKLRNYFEKSKNTGVVACYLDNEITIKKIILNKLKDFKGLTSENVNMIVDNCNFDRSRLSNEINKIKTYFAEKKIEKKELEILLNLKVNDNFNILKDEALNGNKIKTNKLLSDTTIESEKNILYLSLINQRLNKLAEASKLSTEMNLENAINIIKPPIFWKDKPTFMLQAKKWNSNKIKKILNKTYNLEIEFKSNAVVNKSLLLKKLMVDICQIANS